MKRVLQNTSEGVKKTKIFSGTDKKMIKSLSGLNDSKLMAEYRKISLEKLNTEQSHCNIYVPFTKKNLPMKERVGRGFYYWCKNHQNEAFGGSCPKWEQFPLNHGILKLESLEDTAIWLAVDENEITIPGYHIHQGKPKKTIDDNYPSLILDGVEISATAGISYLKTKASGLPMNYVECPNCHYAHSDEDWFAENTHTKHLCKNCGKNFNNDKIGNPWVRFATNHSIEKSKVKVSLEKLATCEKIEKWNAQERHALMWTYTHKNEKGGFHVHGWLDGKKIIDGTFDVNEEEEKQIDILIAKLEKEKQTEQELEAKVEQSTKTSFVPGSK